jgi:hypothetical protein
MKKTLLTVSFIVIALAGLALRWYLTAPRNVVQQWLVCGSDHPELLTKKDRSYWDEWEKRTIDGSFAIYNAACLAERTVTSSAVNGLTAVVTVRSKSPSLSYEEMTEFPAMATRTEKVAALRDRASSVAKFDESTAKVKLSFESLAWHIVLDLEPKIFVARAIDEAERDRSERKFSEAITAYDSLLERGGLSDADREAVQKGRIAAFAEKACIAALRGYLKYPAAAAYSLTGFADSSNPNKAFVSGSIEAPNAFGVRGKLSASCDVVFQSSVSKASVDIFMFKPEDPSSIISEDDVSVDL